MKIWVSFARLYASPNYTWQNTYKMTNRNYNTSPNESSKACSFCLISYKTIGMHILKNCIWGDQFLYQKSRRLHCLNITAEFMSPHCCPALCPGLWIVVLGTNVVFWSFRGSHSTISLFLYPPCPFGTLISILLFSAFTYLNLFSHPSPIPMPCFLIWHLYVNFYSSFPPLNHANSFFFILSSCYPCYNVCTSSESGHSHKDHTPLLSKMPQIIHRDVVMLKSNTPANGQGSSLSHYLWTHTKNTKWQNVSTYSS